jgi:hypothetical protein
VTLVEALLDRPKDDEIHDNANPEDDSEPGEQALGI